MNDEVFSYQFLCKLLNISFNHALLEGADKTRDIILCISDIIRYVYDDRKKVVTLEDELNVIEKYFFIQVMNGLKLEVKHGSGFENYGNVFITHLSILRIIIDDIQKQYYNDKVQKKIEFYAEFDEDTLRIKKITDGDREEYILQNRILQ